MFKKNVFLENKIKRAVEDSTPEILPELLQLIEREGVREMKDTAVVEMPSRRSFSIDNRKILALVASLIFVLGGLVGFFRMPQSTIGLDVNPSLELEVNRLGKVLRTRANNEEAQLVLGDMNLKNVDLDVAVNALIGSMVKNGYIDEMKNSILITVTSKNEQKGLELQEHLTQEVNTLLDGFSLSGSVLSQLSSEDEEVKALAERFSISQGKASLINQLSKLSPNLKLEELAKLPINDIKLLMEAHGTKPVGISSTGKASAKSYIGAEKAKEIAFAHAKVNEKEVTKLEIELDYEDSQMVYEVEFYVGNTKYGYEISAIDGRILEHEMKSTGTSGNKMTESPGSSTSSSSDYIGTSRAEDIAFKHLGITKSSVTSLKTKLEKEDGRMIYEVEFYYDGKEYEVEIDAKTGKILDVEIETKKSSTSSSSTTTSSSSSSPTSSSGSGDYIGTARAVEIALSYVGVTKSSVTGLEVELDREDGRMIYEVEFYYGDKEYEIELDAYSGEILDVEIETKKSSSAKPSSSQSTSSEPPKAPTSEPPKQETSKPEYISASRAEDIALGHAGLTRGQIRKLETEVDYEDGRRIYEVEFKYDIYEYEYEIDAITGAIQEWDKELD